MSLWQRTVRNCQRGASAVEYAGLIAVVAVLMLAVAPAIAAHGDEIGTSIEQVIRCHIASFAGGGQCAAPGSIGGPIGIGGPVGIQQDKPWWQSVWDEIWKEREFPLWADFLNFIKQHPEIALPILFPGIGFVLGPLSLIPGLREPIGSIASAWVGFLGDLLLGIDDKGKFSIGSVGIAVISDLLIFADGIGLLGKAGALGRVAAWLEKIPGGKFLLRLPELASDLLKGKWGTYLRDVLGPIIAGRWPKLANIIKAVSEFKIFNIEVFKTAGNYLWRVFLKEGPIGLVQDIGKTLLKDVLARGILKGTPLGAGIEWLFREKAVRDIIKWIQHPTWPKLWPFGN